MFHNWKLLLHFYKFLKACCNNHNISFFRLYEYVKFILELRTLLVTCSVEQVLDQVRTRTHTRVGKGELRPRIQQSWGNSWVHWVSGEGFREQVRYLNTDVWRYFRCDVVTYVPGPCSNLFLSALCLGYLRTPALVLDPVGQSWGAATVRAALQG